MIIKLLFYFLGMLSGIGIMVYMMMAGHIQSSQLYDSSAARAARDADKALREANNF